MRPIKFRAWDKEIKTMSNIVGMAFGYWADIFPSNPHIIKDDITKKMVKWDEVEVMQFTGLHDKNGKEIWEGDIVKSELHRVHPPCIGVVGYYGMAFHYEGKNGLGEYWFDTITADIEQDLTVEVLGNIYEHGHLINGK